MEFTLSQHIDWILHHPPAKVSHENED